MRGTALGLGALVLAGCAASAGEPGPIGPQGQCRVEPAQAFIGRQASAQAGAELLRATGARVIRWVPPRTLITMDFQPDRLTVHYDDAMVIERVACT